MEVFNIYCKFFYAVMASRGLSADAILSMIESGNLSDFGDNSDESDFDFQIPEFNAPPQEGPVFEESMVEEHEGAGEEMDVDVDQLQGVPRLPQLNQQWARGVRFRKPHLRNDIPSQFGSLDMCYCT
ncbi:hypothetical protein WDU94_008940 [Cyamophila willieti]